MEPLRFWKREGGTLEASFFFLKCVMLVELVWFEGFLVGWGRGKGGGAGEIDLWERKGWGGERGWGVAG